VLEAGAANSNGIGNRNFSGGAKGNWEKELALSPAFAASTLFYTAVSEAEQVKLIATAEDKASKVKLTAEGDAKILLTGEGAKLAKVRVSSNYALF